jgi:hypothetical protein
LEAADLEVAWLDTGPNGQGGGRAGGLAHAEALGHDPDRGERLVAGRDAAPGGEQAVDPLGHERAVGDLVGVGGHLPHLQVVARLEHISDGCAPQLGRLGTE